MKQAVGAYKEHLSIEYYMERMEMTLSLTIRLISTKQRILSISVLEKTISLCNSAISKSSESQQ